MESIRNNIPEFVGPLSKNLKEEGNLYYDKSKGGIGFHGDAERRKVIEIRLGGTIPLHYQWFRWSKPVGDRIKIDLYIMSEKVVRFDWMKKKTLTLRHAAGCDKFTMIKEKSKSRVE